MSDSIETEPAAPLPGRGEQAASPRTVVREEMSPVLRTAWHAVAALGLAGAAMLIAEGRLEAAALTLVGTVLVALPGLPGARTGDRGQPAPPAFGARELAAGAAVIAVLVGIILYLLGGWHALAYFATLTVAFAAKFAVEAVWRRSPAEMPSSKRFRELADPGRALPAPGAESAASSPISPDSAPPPG
jgi:hypothetical protein